MLAARLNRENFLPLFLRFEQRGRKAKAAVSITCPFKHGVAADIRLACMNRARRVIQIGEVDVAFQIVYLHCLAFRNQAGVLGADWRNNAADSLGEADDYFQ